jgi:hypothetical protein
MNKNQIKIDRDYKVFNNTWEKHCFFIVVNSSADSGDIDSVFNAYNLKGQINAKHCGYYVNLSFQPQARKPEELVSNGESNEMFDAEKCANFLFTVT